jgi:pimeloyl-ACP methyl ester carboxylesterase
MLKALVHAASALLLISFSTLAVPVSAETPDEIISVEHWSIYGTNHRFVRDATIPGGTAVKLPARAVPGDEWASAASVPLRAAKAGQLVRTFFWVRADLPAKVPVMLLAKDAPYPSFARTVLDVTPAWQRVVVSGTAPSDFDAGSQLLSVRFGNTSADILLGPVLLATGRPSEARVNAAFASFRPAWVPEDISIPSDPGVILAGTLWTPIGHGPGPFPTVVLLHGSGPAQRDGVGPFTERLLGDGIAVLEYDKRGVGQSTGKYVDTLQNMESDAAAAVRFLRARPEVDAKRIALVGHSQGGAVAPAVAAQDPTIAAVVMFAGPVAPPVPPGPGHEINFIILKNILSKAGADPAAIQQLSEAAERLFEAETHNSPPSQIAELREAVIRGYIACRFNRPQAEGALATLSSIVLEAFNAHFAETLQRVGAPVLALYASKDANVLTPSHMPDAKAALANNRDATVVEIADVDHFFRHVERVSALEKAYPGSIGAPEVIKLVGDWLDARLHP